MTRPKIRGSLMAGFQIEVTTTVPSESVTLPFVTGYTYDCIVDWNDGAPVSVTAWDDVNATHVYATPGTYTVEITGQADAWSVNDTHSSKLQWTDIIYWGDAVDFDGFAYLTGGFWGCSNIISLGTSKIISNGLTSLRNCFRGCGLTGSIPDGLLDNCVSLASMYACWHGCSGLTGSIPDGLLDNCVLLTIMTGCWYGCSGLTGSIPDGLLDNCPLITSIGSCWLGCNSLTGSIPDGLLDNCPLITTMAYCWFGCSGLQISPWIFYNDGQQSTRFLNQSVNFTNCFYNTGTATEHGVAPDLWNCDFGTGTPTLTDCWHGQDSTDLLNWKNIPVAWGGDAVSAPTISAVSDDIVKDGQVIELTATDALPYKYDYNGGFVEIGDAAIYGACTVLIDQLVTEDNWSDTLIVIKAIKKNLPNNVWIYLTTDRGDQAAGFAITLMAESTMRRNGRIGNGRIGNGRIFNGQIGKLIGD